jgi:hypothetical protein
MNNFKLCKVIDNNSERVLSKNIVEIINKNHIPAKCFMLLLTNNWFYNKNLSFLIKFLNCKL